MKTISIHLLILSITTLVYSQQVTTFSNPILKGFYPDPSICRVDNDYYMVNSTFAYYPGIPVFHSTDLINWKQIGHVFNRPEQLDLNGLGVSRGNFAPAIRYHKGLFYITGTIIDGKGNFIVTAKHPAGPWSQPVYLPEVDGIDPSPFFDDDGKTYIVYNSIPPNNTPIYDGHRTIRMYEIDITTLTVKGENHILVNGGTDFSKKPVWIEGPHLLKKDDYYYLIAAEGGTSVDHSEVVFRSTKITGPYHSYENNPILTQRHLSNNRPHPITSTGHADLVVTPYGEWWGVFLGCRPYSDNYYNTGRETFMAPVIWKNGWPTFALGGDQVRYQYPLPKGSKPNEQKIKYTGNFIYRDNFEHHKLALRWTFLRTVKKQWYTISKDQGTLTLQTRPEQCSGTGNPSFIAHRQQHMMGHVTTALQFDAVTPNEKAGLIAFQNEKHFYYLCKSIINNTAVIELYTATDTTMKLLATKKINPTTTVFLKIEAHKNSYAFLFATQKGEWKLLKDQVDNTFLSTEVARGFVGSMYAMYTTSMGTPSKNTATYDWFEYVGTDEEIMNTDK